MLYREIIAVCSQIKQNTQIYCVGQKVEFLNAKLLFWIIYCTKIQPVPRSKHTPPLV
jgi:hypothetical protein